ncbi:DUF7529 family protein [Halorhabdus amylolytica]|uniref:DUF7529 family protein n=1 Tax=Halorhabdus amylolytica TaxID=2559573 RepID=UPI0020BD538A|nr:hypothetical protein [Halorhabdus amylolytica]
MPNGSTDDDPPGGADEESLDTATGDPTVDGVPRNVQAGDGWQTVLDEQAGTAESYREDGWETLELHPGDSVFVDSEDRTGLDVLLSGPEYERLEAMAADHGFDEVEVFRAVEGPTVYLLIVERAREEGIAVLVPAYYDRTRASDALETVRTAGKIRLFCRRLDDDYVEFCHDDPAPFLPAEE